jgi:ABC-type Zn uptake system ZnuABC Zn-binding protein ZnuA
MKNTLILLTLISLLLSACQPAGGNAPRSTSSTPKVLAVETFLADIAQNVAGDRLKVESLIPTGLDPHAFVPTPRDVAKISDSQVLILNGANLEAWLEPILKSAGGERLVVEAAAGLKSRQGQAGEPLPDEPGGPTRTSGWTRTLSSITSRTSATGWRRPIPPARTSIPITLRLTSTG